LAAFSTSKALRLRSSASANSAAYLANLSSSSYFLRRAAASAYFLASAATALRMFSSSSSYSLMI
jgi:hypothetical protein